VDVWCVCVCVQFDDGAKDPRCPMDDVRALADLLAVGTPVVAKWHGNGKDYPGKVVDIGLDTYSIQVSLCGSVAAVMRGECIFCIRTSKV
jgi:hypothetical protein